LHKLFYWQELFAAKSMIYESSTNRAREKHYFKTHFSVTAFFQDIVVKARNS